MDLLKTTSWAPVVFLLASCTMGCTFVDHDEKNQALDAKQVDKDGDGQHAEPWGTDCDDENPAVWVGAREICDGLDNDCNGTNDVPDDVDKDGDGYLLCDVEEGTILAEGLKDGSDCDDNDATLNFDDADGDDHFSCLVDCKVSAEVSCLDDCNDDDDLIHPGATERCNGVDDDCDGDEHESGGETDSDGDGYVSCASDGSTWAGSGSEPTGFGDCDESNPAIHPGAQELCDEIDSDCDGVGADPESTDALLWYADVDLDGFGDATTETPSCETPLGMIADNTDCDDAVATSYPGADEVCNGADDNCDGVVDEDTAVDALTWYADSDADTYGDLAATHVSCVAPSGYVADYTDCNDGDTNINPGAGELCSTVGVDDDCDTQLDEDSATDALTFYQDVDGDSYGDPLSTSPSCAVPSGYVANDEDCDDTDSEINPTTVWYLDTDLDGYGSPSGTTLTQCAEPISYARVNTDCDDTNAAINPSAQELCNTPGVDDDCDGQFDEDDAGDASPWFIDADNDTFGDQNSPAVPACIAPNGYVLVPGDCDDTRAHVNPGATEICDGGDTNCDGDTISPPFDEDDSDGDGYVHCVVDPNADWLGTGLPQGGDCNDNNAQVNPASTEVCDPNDTDEDCDGVADDNDSAVLATTQSTWYPDSDGDLHGDYTSNGQAACDAPNGYVDNNHDCNEGNSTFHGNTYYTDTDQDGYGESSSPVEAYELNCATTPPNGYALLHEDCDDSLATVNPGATEDCNNSVDNDCDGNPPSTDSDCSSSCTSETFEICDDGCDNNYDGLIDCADTMMCGSEPACGGGSGGVVAEDGGDESTCWDNIDNDNDGDVDCCDLDCAQHQCCQTPSCPQNNGPNGSNSCVVAQNHCTSTADCSDTLCTDTFTALCVDPTPTNTVAAPNTIPDFTQLTCGALHTCGLTSGGQVDCWGDNAANQSDIPTAAHSLSFTEIVAGAEHTCGLAEDSNGDEKVVCWGDNTVGQSGSSISTGFYEAFSGSGPYTDLAAGYYHTCVALDDGSIECVGDNTYGQTDATALANIQSHLLANNSTNMEVLSAGGFHTCAIDDNGYLYCWGRDDINQVGGPNGSNNTYSDVATGELYTCALRTNAQGVQCWGDTVLWDSTSPWGTNQPPGSSESYDSGNGNLADFDNLYSGGHHVCSTVQATSMSGGGGHYDTVACWGWDDDGQVSDGPLTTTGSGTVTHYLSQNGQIRAGCSGARHNCFYYEASGNGYLECWGDNCQGQACTDSSCSSGTCP